MDDLHLASNDARQGLRPVEVAGLDGDTSDARPRLRPVEVATLDGSTKLWTAHAAKPSASPTVAADGKRDALAANDARQRLCSVEVARLDGDTKLWPAHAGEQSVAASDARQRLRPVEVVGLDDNNKLWTAHAAEQSASPTVAADGKRDAPPAGRAKRLKRDDAPNPPSKDDPQKLRHLPPECLFRILFFIGDASAIHFRSIMKNWKIKLPDLEVLLVDPPDDRHDEDYPSWSHHSSLTGKLCVVINTTTKIRYEREDWALLDSGVVINAVTNQPVSGTKDSCDHNKNYKTCHDVINLMPPKYATTITHLYLRAIRGRGEHQWEHAEMLLSDPFEGRWNPMEKPAVMFGRSDDNYPIENYHRYLNHGRYLINLKTLQVVHPPVGHGYCHGCPNEIENLEYEGEDGGLSRALIHLCCNVRRTLQALSIKAHIRLSPENAGVILGRGRPHKPCGGMGYLYPVLNYLEVLVCHKDRDYDHRSTWTYDYDSDDSDAPEPFEIEDVTTKLQSVASNCSPVLKKAPSVYCHHVDPPWPNSTLAMQCTLFLNKEWNPEQVWSARELEAASHGSYNPENFRGPRNPWPHNHCPYPYKRSTFRGIHSCVIPDENAPIPSNRQELDDHLRFAPEGWSGRWCGFVKKCACKQPFPEPEDLRWSGGRGDKVPYMAYRLGDVCLADPENGSKEHDSPFCGWEP